MYSKTWIIYFLIVVISLLSLINYFSLFDLNLKTNYIKIIDFLKIEPKIARDFYRYNCKNIKRIGGFKNVLSKIKDESYRIDGAWFICFDKKLELIAKNCRILSFGINHDYTFDEQMNNDFKCQVESFDPFVEANMFRDIRNRSPMLENAKSITVNEYPVWRFHRIGIIGSELIEIKKQVGWFATFDEILKYIQLEEKIIDVLKMDIEYSDFSALNSLKVDYLCKYVKQFVLETHPTDSNPANTLKMLNVVRKLEKCFLLFRRDTRFFLQFEKDQYGSYKTEFQEPKTFNLNLKYFSNEIHLINFMVTYGELYFVNSNFLI